MLSVKHIKWESLTNNVHSYQNRTISLFKTKQISDLNFRGLTIIDIGLTKLSSPCISGVPYM